MQYSETSHCSFTAGRHNCDEAAYWHESVQQDEVAGSHSAPERSWHVDRSQHEDSFCPGSHSSPGSRIPLPHWFREMTSRLPGVYRQVVLSVVPSPEQILPTEHGEKVPFVFGWLTGLIMYAPFARNRRQHQTLTREEIARTGLPLQLCAVSGQHCWLSEQPLLQSWMAPKLCPTSWAKTCHSRSVMVVTPVPEVTSPWLLVLDPTRQSVPSQATPTSLPLEHEENRCQRPAPSDPPFLPLHCEKADNLPFKSRPEPFVPHPTFHGTELLVVEGQLASCTFSSTTPRETLNVRWYSADTVLIFVNNCVRVAFGEP